MGFINQQYFDGPAGIHVRFEDWEPDAEGAPLTPWVVLSRDHGPGEIRFTPQEWEWVISHGR
jgi:hypothetical protein